MASGAEVLEALMVKFYQRVSADELLWPLFGEMAADHPRHVAQFVGEVTGGRTTIPLAGTAMPRCWFIISGEISQKHSGASG